MTIALEWMDYPRGVLNKYLCVLLWEVIGWSRMITPPTLFVPISSLMGQEIESLSFSSVLLTTTYSIASLSYHNHVLPFPQFMSLLIHSRLSFFRKNEANFHFVSGLFPPRSGPRFKNGIMSSLSWGDPGEGSWEGRQGRQERQSGVF